MSGQYQYLFGNWQRARIDLEIPLYGVYIVGKLNDVGYMQGTFKLDQSSKTSKTNADLVDSTTPYRNFIVVVRDGVPVWGGYITSRTYQSQAKAIQFYARAFEGYPDEVVIGDGSPFNLTTAYTSVGDQGAAFVSLLSEFTQDDFHDGMLWPLSFSPDDSNVPFDGTTTYPVTGINKDYLVYGYDLKTRRQVIDEIANSDDGFDWRIVPRFVSDQSVMNLTGPEITPPVGLEVHKHILFGYPTFGEGLSYSGFVFEYPGNILNYYRTDNLAGGGSTVIGVGAGQGETMLIKQVQNNELVSVVGGFAPKHIVVPLKHIDTQANLDARTLQENVKRKPPKLTYKVSLRPSLRPTFGTYDLGSRATLIIQDPMHPNGSETQVTVVEYALRPAESESGAEQIDLGFAGDLE